MTSKGLDFISQEYGMGVVEPSSRQMSFRQDQRRPESSKPPWDQWDQKGRSHETLCEEGG
jgi:hypothetical protein